MAIKILVVDDLKDSADTMAMLMAINGFVVRHAYDGDSALKVANEFVPDVVLSDLNMPVITGYGLCQMLKMDPRFSSALFIAQTADNSPASRSATAAIGFHYHLVKPIDMKAMIDMIGRHFPLPSESAAPAPSRNRAAIQ